MNLKLLGPRVVIRPEALPEVSDGGVALLGGTSTLRGEVLAIGNGPSFLHDEVGRALGKVKKKLEGYRAVTAVEEVEDTLDYGHLVQPGDRVIFSPGAGQELIFEQEMLVVMAEDDILAVVDVE